ncbi:MAG: hypothetical protein QOH57_3901, partial [Mycobacterium sp.]|nr:hypothetical protein [Mycobacterium sp.]
MIRKRICGVLATAGTALGLATGLMMPVANADVQTNGYDVSCKQVNANQAVCSVGGCPRVYEDYAGDVVHTRVNALPQKEIGKSCGATITETVNSATGFNYAVQGCRKHKASGDDCGAWSDYKFTPPAPAPAAPAPAPAPAPAAPQTKQCSDGSVIPVANTCPVKKVAPKNAVAMNVQKAGLQVNVTVRNTSDLAAECTYDATEANG